MVIALKGNNLTIQKVSNILKLIKSSNDCTDYKCGCIYYVEKGPVTGS